MIHKKNGEIEVREGNPYERLKEYYSEFHVEKEDGELAFMGGLVGSLGYDFIRYTEVLPDSKEDTIGIETAMSLEDNYLTVYQEEIDKKLNEVINDFTTLIKWSKSVDICVPG